MDESFDEIPAAAPPDGNLPCVIVEDGEGARVKIPLAPGQTVARTIYGSGLFAAPPMCSGMGRCGRCAVRVLSPPPAPLPQDEAVLGAARVQEGERLACRHQASDGMVVRVDARRLPHPLPDAAAPLSAKDGAYSLAVDLGTTSLCWRAVRADSGAAAPLAQGTMTNPQMAFGADVMSRIGAALDPALRPRLRDLVARALNRVLNDCAAAGLGSAREVCIAANAAMTAILHPAADLRGLAAAPYRLPWAGDSEAAIPGLSAPVYFPAQAAPFVGGDISAGMACLLATAPQESYPFFYADLGTNAEFVLALSRERSLAASVPLGPALEGVGLACGRTVEGSGAGCATRFSLTPQGLSASCPEPSAPVGISATGYISLLASLVRIGALGKNGQFAAAPPSVLAARILRLLAGDHPAGRHLRLENGLLLFAADIEEILKVKAAFTFAAKSLLAAADLPPDRVRGWRVAGALGLHADPADMETLGFLPPGAPLSFEAVGNLALEGAARMLGADGAVWREIAARWARSVRIIDLVSPSATETAFIDHMVFSF